MVLANQELPTTGGEMFRMEGSTPSPSTHKLNL